MSKLLTVFDDGNPINNVISTLTLDIDEVFYLYHHEAKKISFTNIEKVIKKYKDIEINFLQLTDDRKEIKEIINKHKDVIVDVGGSKYLSLVLFECSENNRIIYYDDEENVIKNYKSHNIQYENVFKLDIEDILRLKGGVIKSHMHIAGKDTKTTNCVKRIFEDNLNNYSSFIRYIQKINSLISSKNHSGNSYFINDEAYRRIINDEAYKYIGDLFTIKDNILTFKTSRLKEMVCVSGSFLENYIYIKLTESGLFDDVTMSAVIDFSDEKQKQAVRCELDCLAIHNNHLLLISCKSNKADTNDLNEIFAHNARFGNNLSSPVLCLVEELDEKSPSIYAKAQELNVRIVDKSCFEKDNIAQCFKSIIDGTYSYDELL